MSGGGGGGGATKRVTKISEFIAHGSSVTACSIGHKSNRIAATGGEDKKVNLWTLSKPTCIMSLTGHTSAVHSITFSSNEDKIVSGSASGPLKVWDLEVSKLICNLVGHKSNVTCLEYHTYADYIASGSIDAQIRLWDLRRKGCIFTYKGHSNGINALRFSPDSKWIASVSDDSLVKIWDLKAGRLLTDLKGHSAAVTSLEFHPNEFLLATGSADRTVRFWDLEKMENVSTSPQTPSAIKVIKFEQNGKCLFAGSQDYLQSFSWEPSECYDSVFCQWKQVVDMTNSSNKLTAAAFSQNMVSFYMVDLLQVAPIGVTSAQNQANELEMIHKAAAAVAVSSVPSTNQQRPLSSSTRKNFHHYDKIEASEQPDENQVLQQQQNEAFNSDNSQAAIYNEEEYNKIFRPVKELRRPASSNAIASTRKQSVKTDNPVDQSFFIDIKVAPHPGLVQNAAPAPPLQPLPPITPIGHSQSSNAISSFGSAPQQQASFAPAPVQLQPTPPVQLQPAPPVQEAKVNINDFMPSEESRTKLEISDLNATIELGHNSFMKAMSNRLKNMQIVRQMWINGNIKLALDAAVNMNDSSLMADILNQINLSVNVWSLDICTILLPSIKELIASKYEEHAHIGSDSCKIIFKNFGKIIKANLVGGNGVSVGVDISREERQRKCNSCYSYFQDIVSIIERKITSIGSQKLQNNFREILLLMKTLES